MLPHTGASTTLKFKDTSFTYIEWAGLQTTAAFLKLPQSDRDRILSTIAIELTGKDTAGNSKTQNGKDAGC